MDARHLTGGYVPGVATRHSRPPRIQNFVMPGGEGDRLRGNHCIDIIEFCTRHMPHWNHTSISARNMRDQGLSSVQEVAFGLYQGVFTVRAALARGLEVDAFAPRITFFFSAENELLEGG